MVTIFEQEVDHADRARGASALLDAELVGRVAQAYQEQFTLDPVAEKEEWCRITGVKK